MCDSDQFLCNCLLSVLITFRPDVLPNKTPLNSIVAPGQA